MEHFFRNCPVSRRLWMSSDIGIRAENGSNLTMGQWIIVWVSYFDKLVGCDSKMVKFLAVLWCLWSARNQVLFQGASFHPLMFFRQYNQLVGVAIRAFNGHKNGVVMDDQGDSGRRSDQISWVKESNPVPVIGTISACDPLRIMVDAGWKSMDNAGIGWVVFSDVGRAIGSDTRRIRAESALQAEGIGLLEVMKWAVDQGFHHMEVSSDCLQLILFIAEIQKPHQQLADILRDIIALATSFHCFAFSFIPRHLNSIAHSLACEAMIS
ncbi:uncharacterized protein LOC141617238 [Silene latifolia]|uniref:uncharacterized protein LOC141617238 n=1 Tax=Silene latifolia TaxID=37657 RepID=UPI003D76FC52